MAQLAMTTRHQTPHPEIHWGPHLRSCSQLPKTSGDHKAWSPLCHCLCWSPVDSLKNTSVTPPAPLTHLATIASPQSISPHFSQSAQGLIHWLHRTLTHPTWHCSMPPASGRPPPGSIPSQTEGCPPIPWTLYPVPMVPSEPCSYSSALTQLMQENSLCEGVMLHPMLPSRPSKSYIAWCAPTPSPSTPFRNSLTALS